VPRRSTAVVISHPLPPPGKPENVVNAGAVGRAGDEGPLPQVLHFPAPTLHRGVRAASPPAASLRAAGRAGPRALQLGETGRESRNRL